MSQPGGRGVQQARQPNLMRQPATAARVTNIELFFDLVYVFAVTQLSHYLLAHQSLAGALRTGLLLIMVWTVWAYTTWVTNWLDPGRIPVRLLLLGLAGASLVIPGTRRSRPSPGAGFPGRGSRRWPSWGCWGWPRRTYPLSRWAPARCR